VIQLNILFGLLLLDEIGLDHQVGLLAALRLGLLHLSLTSLFLIIVVISSGCLLALVAGSGLCDGWAGGSNTIIEVFSCLFELAMRSDDVRRNLFAGISITCAMMCVQAF